MTRLRALLNRNRDRGSGGGGAIEILIIAPVFILLLLLCIAGGRYVLGSGKIDQAAASAARAASITSTASDADNAAHTKAQAALTDSGITCQNLTVTVDTTAYSLPIGTPGSVIVTLTCTVNMGDLSIPGVPGSRTITSRAASPIAPSRES